MAKGGQGQPPYVTLLVWGEIPWFDRCTGGNTALWLAEENP